MPAPKTVTSCTECRFLMSNVLAKAVRNAVSSSALINAVGAPALSNSVKDPFGVVLSELNMEGAGVPALPVDDVVLMDDLGDDGCSDGLRDNFSRLAVLLLSSGAVKVTILTPKPS